MAALLPAGPLLLSATPVFPLPAQSHIREASMKAHLIRSFFAGPFKNAAFKTANL
jgi:hypothetical protein